MQARKRVTTPVERGIVTFANDAVFVCEQETGNVVDANDAAVRLYGYSLEEMRAMHCAQLYRSAAKTVVAEMQQTLAQHGAVSVSGFSMTRKDGSTFIADVRLQAFDSGSRRLVAALVRDVSAEREHKRELERASRRLATSEATFRGLVIATDDAVTIADFESGYIIEANPAACAALGYSGDEWNQLTGRLLHPPAYHDEVTQISLELNERGGARRNDVPMRRKDGTIFFADLILNVFEAAGRKLIVSIARDAAQRRRHAEELEESYRKLQSAQAKALHAQKLAAVGEVAAGVAHEINNPAAFVSMNLDVMLEQLVAVEQLQRALRGHIAREPDVARKNALMELLERHAVDMRSMRSMLNDNREGIERIRSVTRDLRIFSRVEQSEVTEVALDDVVRSTLNLLMNELRHRARVTVDLGDVPRIHAQRGKLAQVLTNLLVNASQAIVEGAADSNEIRVCTELDGDAIVITVEDTGQGMSPDVAERIFDPFFTTKPREQGTGLGLSLCAEIVAAHRGRLRVSSRPKEGSRFEVRIPLDTGLSADPPPPSVPRKARRTTKRILVIDDDASMVRAYRRMFSDYDAQVVPSGARALEAIAKDDSFDLVICDLMMPDMDGLQVYEAIAERHPELLDAIVFCTGGAFTTRTRDFVARVDNPVLDKPVRFEDLEKYLGDTDPPPGSVSVD